MFNTSNPKPSSPSPMSPMTMGSSNVYNVTLNGQTKVIVASSDTEAAQKAFGFDWARAMVQKIQAKGWM